jgi:hypothetical protein
MNDPMPYKECCRCNKIKPLITFVVDSSSDSGYKPFCKACQAAKAREPAMALKAKERYERNKEIRKLKAKEWSETNPVARKAAWKRYNKKNYVKNKERARLESLKNYYENREIRLTERKERYSKDEEFRTKRLEANRLWKLKNADKMKEYRKLYKARKKAEKELKK